MTRDDLRKGIIACCMRSGARSSFHTPVPFSQTTSVISYLVPYLPRNHRKTSKCNAEDLLVENVKNGMIRSLDSGSAIDRRIERTWHSLVCWGGKRPCVCCPTCRPRTYPCTTRFKPKKDKDRAFLRAVLQSLLHQKPSSKPSIGDTSPLPSLNSRLLASLPATERRPRRPSQYHGSG
jgi:hypothetical protein